jgi:GDP-mannose 6-dehydrogenase
MTPPSLSTVVVFGLGYVGSVTAACLARLGHQVYCIDKDDLKVDRIQAGRAPFFEPGLDQLIGEMVASGRLSASKDARGALDKADIVLICVGTPSAPNGNLALDQLERVFVEIRNGLVSRQRSLLVAVRSTVFRGRSRT